MKARRSIVDPTKSLAELKRLLKRRFQGSLVRAWRCVFCNRRLT